MKLTIDRAALAAALKHVAAAADSRSSLPALTCVLLRLSGKKLTLAATDANVTATAEIAATGDDGSMLVGAAPLLRIVERLAGKEVTIAEDKEAMATITSGRAKASEPRMSPRDFPKVPARDGVTAQMDAAALASVIEACLPAVCNDETRFHLNGVLLHFHGDRVVGVATDGHRLHLRAAKTPCHKSSHGVIVPHRALAMILRLLDGAATVDVTVDATTISSLLHISRDGLTITTKLIDAQFPPYLQVIPAGYPVVFTSAATAIAEAVRRVGLASGPNSGVLLDTSGSDLLFAARDGDRAASDAVEVGGAAATGKLASNLAPRYILDAIASLSSDAVAVHASGELDPVLFCPSGQAPTEDGGSLAVVMPMRR